jgi:hypothetical protein
MIVHVSFLKAGYYNSDVSGGGYIIEKLPGLVCSKGRYSIRTTGLHVDPMYITTSGPFGINRSI